MALALGLTGLLLAIPAGFVSDRKGRRITVTLGALIWAASLVSISISSEPIYVILSYAVAGVGTVLFDVSLPAFYRDVSSQEKLGRVYGIYNSSIQIGFACGPAVGAVLLLQTGYRSIFLVTAVLPLVAAVMVLKPIIPYKEIVEDTVDVGQSSEPSIFRNRAVWLGCITTFCVSLLVAGISVLAPLYVRFNGFSEVFIGVLFTVQATTGAFGRFLFGNPIDRSDKVVILMAFGLLSMTLATIGFALSSSWLWLLLMMMLFGLGLALGFMSANVSIARRSNGGNRGLTMGFASMFRYAGFMVGPWIGSLVVSSQDILELGYSYGFMSLAGVAIVIILLILTQVRWRK
jgi:MFS family permease